MAKATGPAAGEAPMECVRTLAGVEMPRILYGTAWKKERTRDLVVQAVLAGFRGKWMTHICDRIFSLIASDSVVS